MNKTKIVFLILPHVHLMDLAGADQVFHEATYFNVPVEVIYCAAGDTVHTSAHLPLGKLPHFSSIPIATGDFLIIPGAELSYILSDEFKKEAALFEWIRTCRQAGVKVCSICSGAFVLAESGLLNGLQCTTHWKHTTELQQLYPKVKITENILFTEDDGVYTSAGVAAGIDLALHILEQMSSGYIAHKVARELVIYTRRSGNHVQQSELLNFRNHIHASVHQVQDWLHENLHKKTSIRFLAGMVHMSERNFTRTFKKETSVTVNGYINSLRKERIAELLNNADISRSEIARQCGLRSERQITRLINQSV